MPDAGAFVVYGRRNDLSSPWDIYDEMIAAIDPAVTVTAGSAGLRWCQVKTSEDSLGISYAFDERSRPLQFTGPTYSGARLRDVAELSKSWNFAEAGIGMAAINAWFSHADRAASAGFTPTAEVGWKEVFDPYAQAVAGKVVSVIGHFPFAPAVLAEAGQLNVLERSTQPGDFPDPACEYLLPESDFVFISSSAFVNKTIPRLLELSAKATTVVLGPSTPLSQTLFDHGVDVVTGLVATAPAELFDTLSGLTLSGMFDAAYRVEQRNPAATLD